MIRASSAGKAGGIFVAMLMVVPLHGAAQQYPVKPIRAILSVAGGGENNARIIMERAAEQLGAPFVLEANGAAGGSISVMSVVRAEPDGYTILYSTAQTIIFRPHLVKSNPYNPVRDLAPIVQIGEATQSVAASLELPVASFVELIEYARRNPGKVSYATNGIGTTGHLSGVVIEKLAGIQMVHVPYKFGTQALPDLMAGRVHLSFAPFSNFASLVQKGKIRMLAITQGGRSENMPELPTVAEVLKGYEVPQGWIAVLGPAAMPLPIARRLSEAIVKSANLPDVKRRVGQVGLVVKTKGIDEFSRSFKMDFEVAGRVIRSSGIEPE